MASKQSSYMLKQGAINTGWKKRWFVLEGNTIAYYKDPKAGKPLGVIPLDGCFLENDASKEHAIRVVHPERRIFYLAPLTAESLKEWVDALEGINVKLQGKNLLQENVMTSQHLRAGYLNKRGHIQKNWKRRYFVLRFNIIFYFSSKEDSIEGKEPVGAIDLFHARASAIADAQSEKPYSFQVFHPHRQTYLFHAGNQVERETWIMAINNAGLPEGPWISQFGEKASWVEEKTGRKQVRTGSHWARCSFCCLRARHRWSA